MALDLKEELRSVTAALHREGIDYAICGGLAVAIHGYPRTTRDIDLLIREENLDRIVAVVKSIGYTLSAGIIPFDTGKPTERRVFRISKTQGEDLLTLDLILVSPFLEDVWAGRSSYQIADQEIQVVSLEGLAKMKRAAGRPQDIADLHQLGLNAQP